MIGERKMKKEMIAIYYVKDNLEVMKKFVELRKDCLSDLSLKYTAGVKKHNFNIGIMFIEGEKRYLIDFIIRNKHLIRNYNNNFVIAL